MPIWLASAAKAIGIKGFAAIGLALALLGCWIGWTHAAHQRDDQIRRNGELSVKLDTSNASIAELQRDLDAKNAESLARNAAYIASQKQATDDAAKLAEQRKASQTQIDRLNALARSGGVTGDCVVPKALADDLEGL